MSSEVTSTGTNIYYFPKGDRVLGTGCEVTGGDASCRSGNQIVAGDAFELFASSLSALHHNLGVLIARENAPADHLAEMLTVTFNLAKAAEQIRAAYLSAVSGRK